MSEDEKAIMVALFAARTLPVLDSALAAIGHVDPISRAMVTQSLWCATLELAATPTVDDEERAVILVLAERCQKRVAELIDRMTTRKAGN